MVVYWIYCLISCSANCTIYSKPLVAAAADICGYMRGAGFAVGAVIVTVHTGLSIYC